MFRDIMLFYFIRKMKRTFADFEDKLKLACFSDKNKKRPHEIAFSSGKTYLFECNVCHHDIHQKIVGVTSRRSWCGFCTNRRLCPPALGCQVCCKKTFASHSPDKALCWNFENNTLRPDEVLFGSASKFWFTCNVCNHDFQQTLDRVTGKARWCAFCTNMRLCPVPRDCSTCFQKTFAGKYPEKALCWSETKNKLRADQVVFGSARKFWFKCAECDHEFHITLDSIRTKGTWCIYCHGRSLCGEIRCVTCTPRSFAGFDDKDKVSSWSGLNKLKPHNVSIGSAIKAQFDCFKCHKTFTSHVYSVTSQRRIWCPYCVVHSKNIQALEKFFSRTQCTYEREKPIKLNNRNLRWDMVVVNGSKLFHIESDGEQHFSLNGMIRVSRGRFKNARKRFEDQRIRDLLKDENIRMTNGLLFRVSFRQLDQISSLVDTMIEKNNAGVTGVVYMDEELYNDWGPIE